MSTECLVIKPANLRFRPIAVVRFSSFADVLLGPFGVLALSLGYVSRVAPSAHAQGLRPVRSPGTNSPLDCLCPGSLPRRRPVADSSSFTSLRGPPDCRSPAPCLRATVARNHVGCTGGLGLAAARTRGAEKRRARGLARSAIRQLTHRGCLSAESEANETSSAMGPRDRCTEPGHKQSCGLFVPGEGPGLWPGPQGSRRHAPTAEHKRRSQAKPAFAWGPSQQAKNIKRTDERTTVRNGPMAAELNQRAEFCCAPLRSDSVQLTGIHFA